MVTSSGSVPADEWRRRKETVRRERALVRRFNAAGVGLLAGTDNSNPFVFPGFSLHDELALLVESGLSALQALQTATLNPAKFLNLTATLGTIAKGKRADMILLDANPLEDIHNTTKINAVLINGRLLDRRKLDSLLAAAKSALSATH